MILHLLQGISQQNNVISAKSFIDGHIGILYNTKTFIHVDLSRGCIYG
jgi:hypothetical protein